MNQFFKILKLTAILIVSVSVILFSASILLQDKVAHIILKSINESLSTRLDVSSFHLSFLRKFPKASLELKDVLVHSSSGFNSEQFKAINTDTLLAAKYVSVEFSIPDIISGNYNIERISAKTGKMNFFYDMSGFVNYNIHIKTDKAQSEDITINLERINLNNINAYYNNLAAKLIIIGTVKNGKLKSRITGDNIEFTAGAETEITSFQLYGTTITKPVKAVLDINLQSSKKGILIRKGSLAIDNYDFGISGFVSSEDVLDLVVTGNNIDIAKIRNYLPDKYLNLVSDYNSKGKMIVDCKIKGPLTRTKNPHVDINFNLNNGYIAYKKSDLAIENLSFSGFLSNGSKNNLTTSQVSIEDINLKLGTAQYAGSLSIVDFNHPKSKLNVKGRIFPGELKEFFNIESISTASGFVDADIKLDTKFWPKDSITLNDILILKPLANLDFNSLSLGFQDDKLLINNINGNIIASDLIQTDNLSFNYKSQNIKVTGEFRNLPEWISGRSVQMRASAYIYFDRFIPETIFAKQFSSDSGSSKLNSFSFPDDLLLDLNFKFDSLYFKSYSCSNISGSLSYKPRLLTFKSFKMDALNGIISGNGFLVQNSSKTIMERGIFNFTDIDVNKAFKTFHNFGQDFIIAENLSGEVSGAVSILIPLDSMLNPQIKSLSAEGKYILVNGALINFDPVKELSTFIELSELENIHFDKLENDFFIKNNFLYVPQMDVKSSAVDLSVNGKHSFDNDYEYHVKVLLSEILSKKRKKNKSNITEFGTVEDDGLGRTSILLKIVNKGEDVKVSYDLKAVSAGVKNNIKTEQKALKSILNQEYGWYKNDTTTNKKQTEKKPRFKIAWEEADTATNPPKAPVVKKKK
jgi:hypothetical protein